MRIEVITNICFLNRDKTNIKEVLNQLKSPNYIIDFNCIIPMPSELKGFVVDTISYKQYYLKKFEWGHCDELNALFEKSGNTDLGKFTTDISKLRPHNDNGTLMYNNELTYGVPSWREFVKKHWGLSENCTYDSSMFNLNTISFRTIKQYPKDIVIGLSKMFPNDLLQVKYASSNPGEYVRSYQIQNGVTVSIEQISDKRYIYCELYKKNPNIFTDICRKETISQIINHVEEVGHE